MDDEQDLLTALQAGLEGMGHAVVVCARGDQVMELVGREHPDLILLDLNLPGLGGEVILKALQSNSLTQRIPVIVITGQPEIEKLTRTFSGGAVSFYPKPLRIDLLKTLIHTILATASRS